MADAAPPKPTQVTVGVEVRPLYEQIITRGKIVSTPGLVVPLPQALVTAGGVVTGTPMQVGQAIYEGSPVLEVNGLPVLAFSWPFRAYRELHAGMSGPDVEQLEKSLVTLGLLVQANDIFDKQTSAALKKHYDNIGYPYRGNDDDKGNVPTAGSSKATDSATQQGASLTGSVTLLPQQVLALPAEVERLESLDVKIGTEITPETKSLGSATAGSLIVNVVIPIAQAKHLVAGDAATISQSGGSELDLTVTEVAADVTDVPELGSGVLVKLLFNASGGVASPTGQTEKVVLSSGGSLASVTAVPLTAVYTNPDGSSYVELPERAAGGRIGITLGDAAGGWVEIRASDSPLEEGTEVVVGKS
ncbi:hypothetical protein [Paenarthrobacter nitroguajacolicus]|uniref:hypothetical protein n=1 Tax=Paenarthrobacter nitroguajacolicus TaxID=211146 RepID=UPI0034436A20